MLSCTADAVRAHSLCRARSQNQRGLTGLEGGAKSGQESTMEKTKQNRKHEVFFPKVSLCCSSVVCRVAKALPS